MIDETALGRNCITCRHEWTSRACTLCGPSFPNWAPCRDHNGPPEPIAAEPTPTVNPKEIAGSKKPSIWSVMPRWVVALVGRVMSVGAAKYGRFNYRESLIAASTYEDAMERHAQLWFDGEDNDPETGVSHLASIMASCALLLDAQATGKLDDDRQKTGLVREKLDELAKLLVDLPLPAEQI